MELPLLVTLLSISDIRISVYSRIMNWAMVIQLTSRTLHLFGQCPKLNLCTNMKSPTHSRMNVNRYLSIHYIKTIGLLRPLTLVLLVESSRRI